MIKLRHREANKLFKVTQIKCDSSETYDSKKSTRYLYLDPLR